MTKSIIEAKKELELKVSKCKNRKRNKKIFYKRNKYIPQVLRLVGRAGNKK